MTLSDKDLASIQAAQEVLLPDTVYVQRLTRTEDDAGGASEVWATVSTTTGRVAMSSGSEQVIADRIGAVVTYMVTLPHDTALLQGDQLQINSRQFAIVSILNRSQKTAMRVVCTEVL